MTCPMNPKACPMNPDDCVIQPFNTMCSQKADWFLCLHELKYTWFASLLPQMEWMCTLRPLRSANAMITDGIWFWSRSRKASDESWFHSSYCELIWACAFIRLNMVCAYSISHINTYLGHFYPDKSRLHRWNNLFPTIWLSACLSCEKLSYPCQMFIRLCQK